jgi:hypothetical protein
MDKILLKVTKADVEKSLGYELEHFSLHPEYVNGECIGLEIDATPKEPRLENKIKLNLIYGKIKRVLRGLLVRNRI